MSIESELKKEGIVVTKTLDTLQVNSIARYVAENLCSKFPEQNLNLNELFIELSRLNMCIAKMPPSASLAKFFYKNSTIYFSDTLEIEDIQKLAIHECIHYIQQSTDKKNKLVRLGLCDFSSSTLCGMGVNEAAVQLMSSICVDSKIDTVKYYGIEFPTISPSYYPLQCNLVKQLSYVTGEDILFNSTLYGNDSFKEKFISLTSTDIFYTIQKNIDSIVYLEDELTMYTNLLANTEDNIKKISKISKKVNKLKNTIAKRFFETQNLIISSYFNKYYTTLTTPKCIENFRNKLFLYKNLIGTNDGYTFFNNYYLDMMKKLEVKYEELGNITTSLIVEKKNIFSILFKKLRLLTSKNYVTERQK